MSFINKWFKEILEREPNKELPSLAYDKFGKDVSSIEIGATNRGFSTGKFTDHYGAECSIQKSSSFDDAIWLGINDADPKIMSSDAIKLGLRERTYDENDNGWVNYEIPKQVLLNTRMHLTQDHVKQLLPLLIKFAETGELE